MRESWRESSSRARNDQFADLAAENDKRARESPRAAYVYCQLELPAIAAAATTATTTATTTTAAATAASAIATTTVVATAATAAIPTAATTTAVATAATAVAAATATAAEAAATTATAAAARLALLGFVDAEGASVEGMAVHALDRLSGFLGRAHGDEREAAGAAGLAIGYQVDVADRSEFLERRADAFSIGVE